MISKRTLTIGDTTMTDDWDRVFEDAPQPLDELITATTILMALERIEKYFKHYSYRRSGLHYNGSLVKCIVLHRRLQAYIDSRLVTLSEFLEDEGGNDNATSE
jgi:hypothetical protein